MKAATLGRTIRPANEDSRRDESIPFTAYFGTSEDDGFEDELRERQYEPCGGGRRIVRKRLGE